MDHYNRNYDPYSRRDEYEGQRQQDNYDRYADRDKRNYERPDYGGHYYDHDRNVFERTGDRMRDTWNEWTGRDRDDRYYDNRHNNRNYHRDHDRGFFERAGDKIKEFFRPPGDYNYSSGRAEYRSPDYGSRGFGDYKGSYGAYTGRHGMTGYNTGSRDNYTFDYNDSYRPYRSGYDPDPNYRPYRRQGERPDHYKYDTGRGSYEAGDFGFRDEQDWNRRDSGFGDYDRSRDRW
jgi:hypothetical protein